MNFPTNISTIFEIHDFKKLQFSEQILPLFLSCAHVNDAAIYQGLQLQILGIHPYFLEAQAEFRTTYIPQ